KSARPWGVFHARARRAAGSEAASPKRTGRTGWVGGCRNGRMMSASRTSKDLEGPPKTRRQAAPSRPRAAAVSSTDWSIVPALPSSSGCAQSTSGQRHSRPCRSSASERRNGEPTAIGWTAEQRSCTSPGTVSSPLRAPPPMSSSASRTVTSRPSRASATAAASPLGPAPTTLTELMLRCSAGRRPASAPRSRHRGLADDLHRKVERLLEPWTALDHLRHVDRALLEQAGRRVVDPVVLALDVGRLALEHHDSQLALLVAAL